MINYGFGISLRAIDESQMLREWRNDPEIRRWCREYRLITKNMQNSWVNSLDDRNLMFTIWVEKEFSENKDHCVGVCGLTGIHPVHRSAEFSIYIATEFQRSGYATSALKTLINYGFNECNLHRIYGETFEGNPAMSLYEKLGFVHEGTCRESYYKDGHWNNSHIYGLLRKN